MPLQPQNQYTTGVTAETTNAARSLLNKAGRTVDAAFRSLTASALQVRGKAFLGPTYPNTIIYPFRPVAVSQQNSQNNLSSGSFTKIKFDTTIQDPLLRWSITNFNITLPQPGFYTFSGAIGLTTGAGAPNVIISLFNNGNEMLRSIQWLLAATTSYVIPFNFQFPTDGGTPYFPTGQGMTIGFASPYDIRLRQDGGTTLSTNASTAGNGPITYLNIGYLGSN